jgi:aconitate hydratase
LLGVRAVIAESFERIHRRNLISLGILPLQFPDGVDRRSLDLDGTELVDLSGIGAGIQPRQSVLLTIIHPKGRRLKFTLRLRAETQRDALYLRQGGLLPYILGKQLHQPQD